MNRRVALVAVAVVTVLGVVGASIAAVAAGGQALAYQVNGTRVGQSTIDDQLDDLAGATATKQLSNTSGSIDSRTTAQVLNLNIARDLLRDAADRQGVKVTDGDRTSMRDALGPELQSYPRSYQDLLVEVQATAGPLGLTTDEQFNAFLAKEFSTADVYVNPRYGRWSPRFGVCPPTGCASISTPSSGG